MRLKAKNSRSVNNRYRPKDGPLYRQRILTFVAVLAVICISIWAYGVFVLFKAQHVLIAGNNNPQVAHNHGHSHVLPPKMSSAQTMRQANGNSNECYPRYPFMTGDHVYHLIELWFEANCPVNYKHAEVCRFVPIVQYMLDHAIKHEMTLLTVQIGAMDGVSNDPMYESLIQQARWALRKKDRFHSLENWLPIMFEPMPDNYQNLLKTYKTFQEEKGLPCSIPINGVVSYDSSQTTECKFCRYNVSPDAPDVCKTRKDWQKYQIGSLNCDMQKKFYGAEQFDQCIIQDPLPCGSVTQQMKLKAPYLPEDAEVMIVQIDVEGYEYILLSGLVKDLNPLPPLIHFENKVMKEMDRKEPLPGGMKRNEMAMKTLENVGYRIYEERGEDTIAVYLPHVAKQNVVELDPNVKPNNKAGQDPFYKVLEGIM